MEAIGRVGALPAEIAGVGAVRDGPVGEDSGIAREFDNDLSCRFGFT